MNGLVIMDRSDQVDMKSKDSINPRNGFVGVCKWISKWIKVLMTLQILSSHPTDMGALDSSMWFPASCFEIQTSIHSLFHRERSTCTITIFLHHPRTPSRPHVFVYSQKWSVQNSASCQGKKRTLKTNFCTPKPEGRFKYKYYTKYYSARGRQKSFNHRSHNTDHKNHVCP